MLFDEFVEIVVRKFLEIAEVEFMETPNEDNLTTFGGSVDFLSLIESYLDVQSDFTAQNSQKVNWKEEGF